jgi:cell division protein FtsZ
MENEISITVIATGFAEERPADKVGFQQVEQMQSKKKVVTPEGLEGTEVTIGDLFGDRDEDPRDSKFDIPSFLDKE